jgi:hypothetical protein
VLATLALAGCHAGNAAPQPPSRHQVQEIQDRYAHKSYRAMRERNQKLMASVESGILLHRDIANMKLADRLSQPKKAEEFTYPHSKGYLIDSNSDNEKLLTVSDYSNAKQNWKNLGLYTHAGDTTSAKRVFTGGLYASDVPDFVKEDHRLVPVATDASGFVAKPGRLPKLVTRALQHPNGKAADAFQASDVRSRYANELAANKKRAADVGTVRRHYRPGHFLAAVRTDGGYLEMGSFRFTESITARSGKSVTFKKKSVQRKLYSGKYHRTTSTYGAMFAAVVPKDGKITLVSGEERQTGLTAKK